MLKRVRDAGSSPAWRHPCYFSDSPILQKYINPSATLISKRTFNQQSGGERVRTDDPLRARQMLSQLSYTPLWYYSKNYSFKNISWAWVESNHLPNDYQSFALTIWATGPFYRPLLQSISAGDHRSPLHFALSKLSSIKTFFVYGFLKPYLYLSL